MELVDIIGVLRRYWRSILATLLICGAVGAGLLMLQKPVYASSSTINFLPKAGGSAGQLKSAMDFAQEQAQTYAQLARTPVVLQPVKERLQLPETAAALSSQLLITPSAENATVFVTAYRGDPQSAAALSQGVAEQIVKAVAEYSPPGAEQTLEARVTQPALAPSKPFSPNVQNSIVIALAVGLAAGVAQAFLRNALDTHIENPEDVQRLTSVPVIGEIPLDDSATDNTPTGRRLEPFSLRSEAYRRLRTNLQFRALEGHGNVMVVTSSVAGEGKTSTAANIASAFAQAGQKVLLVDCDLRRPRVHKEFGLENGVGLSSALLHKGPIEQYVQSTLGMDVLTSGPKPPNPSELLGSPSMERLFREVRDAYDVVVFDSPPLLPVTDAMVLGRLGAGVIVVADQSQIRRRQLLTALKNLQGVDAPVLGVVLNKIKLGNSSGYYGYGYKYKTSYNYQYADHADGERGRHASTPGRRSGGRSASVKRGARGKWGKMPADEVDQSLTPEGNDS